MSIIMVGGAARGAGKTALIEGILAAVPEAAWTAIKISSHAHCGAPVFEELERDPTNDTGRYLSAGARRALLVEAAEDGNPAVPLREFLPATQETGGNLLIESNRMVFGMEADLRLAVFGVPATLQKPSFAAFLAAADALVVRTGSAAPVPEGNPLVPIFRMEDFRSLTPEFAEWLRLRLSLRFLSETARS